MPFKCLGVVSYSPSIATMAYLVSFARYSDLLVKNRAIFIPHLYLAPPYGVAPGTIAVSVTRIEREFNACQTPRSMYPSIFDRFWDIATYWSKIATFLTHHLCLAAPQGVTPSEFREDLDTYKTRMNGLSCGEESMTICSAVLIQYHRVTDRQTDGRPAYIYYVLQHSWRT